MRRIVGVVLAAGESRRMGRLKALLPFGSCTVIEQVLQPLLQADLAGVTVILGHRAEEIAAVLASLPVQMLYNPDYQYGMTTSVQVALRDITPLPDAYLLALVDQPNIGFGPIQRLLEAFVHTHKGIIIPTSQGKRGHPIMLAVRYRDAVLALGPQQGLNLVTRGHPEDTLEVPMECDDILRDMDYQADYEAELQRWQHRSQSTNSGRGTRDEELGGEHHVR
jgi:molybdenum cofactor cytidylyltransferase